MSSHREAPEISKDPVADNADVYAFVSPEKDGTVTIISNFVPLQGPAGGPNFYEFGDDVLYSIYIDNNGDAMPDIEYQFQFNSTLQNPNTFLYNTGPVNNLTDTTWNARQFYSVTRIDSGKNPKKGNPPGHDADGGPAWGSGQQHSTLLGTNLPCPPCNVGPHSMPNYPATSRARRSRPSRQARRCSAGSAAIRSTSISARSSISATFAHSSRRSRSAEPPGGRRRHQATEHPLDRDSGSDPMLTKDGSTPSSVSGARAAMLGIWSAASRRKARVFDDHKNTVVESGPWVQVSRLGNPLFNEVIVPIAQKDDWNRGNPVDDEEYLAERPDAGARGADREHGSTQRRFPTWPRTLEAEGRPRRDPAHRDPRRDRSGVPERHRPNPCGHVAAERRDSALGLAEPVRASSAATGGFPERPAALRRRRGDRAACNRRRGATVRRPDRLTRLPTAPPGP